METELDPVEVVGYFVPSSKCPNRPGKTKVRKAIKEIDELIRQYTWNYEVPRLIYHYDEIICCFDSGLSIEDVFAFTHLVFKLSERLPSFSFNITSLEITAFFDSLRALKGGYLFIINGGVYVLKNFNTIDEAVEIDSVKIKEDCSNAFNNQELHRAKITMPEKMFAYFQADPYMLRAAVSLAPTATVTCGQVDSMIKNKYGKTIKSIIKLTRPQYVSLLGKTRDPNRVGTALCLGLQKYMRMNQITDYDRFTFTKFVCKETTADPDGDWIEEYEKRQDDYVSKMCRASFGKDEFDEAEMLSYILNRCEQGDEDVISMVRRHWGQNEEEYDEDEVFAQMQQYCEQDSDWEYIQAAYEEYGKSDYSGYSSDYDSETEVMEAIKSDPDLYMKVLEMQSERGDSVSDIRDFITRFGKVKPPNPSGLQKGVRDIPVERFEDSSLESDADDEVYSETMAQIKARLGNATIEDSE